MRAESFVGWLQKSKAEMSVGSGCKWEHWCVPRTNFPTGLPDQIAQCEVRGELLAEVLLKNQSVDHEMFFVIDQQIPRDKLGQGVTVLFTVMANTRKLELSAPSGASSC